MARAQSRFNALHALLLIFIFQIASLQAHPFARDSLPVLHITSFSGTKTMTIPCTTEHPPDIAYQISDGQVQVPRLTDENTYPGTADIPSIMSPSALSVRDVTTTTSTLQLTMTSTRTRTTTEAALGSSIIVPPSSTILPDSSLTSLTTSAVQTATESGPNNTAGSVVTSLKTLTSQPFLTSVSFTTVSLSLVSTGTLSDIHPTATSIITSLSVGNIFQTIATDPPPSQVTQTAVHPVPPLNIKAQQHKLQTNKFYSNFFLGNQSNAVFTFPYSLNWVRGRLLNMDRTARSWGMAIAHSDRSDVTWAPPKIDPNNGLRTDAGDWSFYSNDLGTNQIVLSANELEDVSEGVPSLTTESLEWGSITVNLVAYGSQTPTIVFPLVHGASIITGIYNAATPLLHSSMGFQNITYVGAVIGTTTFKYTAQLMGSPAVTWLIYITPDPNKSAYYAVNSLTLDGTLSIQGHSNFTGLIQVAKVPMNTALGSDVDLLYDQAAGAYAVTVNITGTVQDDVGSYTLSWTTEGNQNQTLVMFALPHHISSFSGSTAAQITDLQLMTTTKGMATAVQGDAWTMVENSLPIDMDFPPWTPTGGSLTTLSGEALQAIYTAGLAEISQNITAQANTQSIYYDGKALAKFAAIVYVLHQLVQNKTLALTGLLALEAELEYHIQGQQTFPLYYESVWGGAVSSASYITGNSGADFGNTYYNDHHFHYGYFVYAAAVIGFLDPDWLEQGTNKAWINMLVRDYANSVTDDPYFPFSRNFDWYHGHSWAAGLEDSADGKNQESSSEDTMASYAVKMWGKVIGDTNMMARGNLMLAIQARSLQEYYLYDNQNTVEPGEFIGNNAAGILFENKIDHTTYFGALPEYIEGIHMIPILPCSTLTRTPTFVQQEWNNYFANYSDGTQPYVDQVQSGWRGILMANYAIVNPESSFAFFNDANFDEAYLDSGASQTWYLTWAAALMESERY